MDKVDFRYVTKDDARDFHRRRRAFVIYKDELSFIEEGCAMSHSEFCSTKFNIEKDEFNKLTRGYYIDGNLVFYKDNFIYDEGVIEEALKYVHKIKDYLKVDKMKIYFGQIIGKTSDDWKYDYYYGDLVDNEIIEKSK